MTLDELVRLVDNSQPPAPGDRLADPDEWDGSVAGR
jgi:hypothetical protein